MLDEWHENDVKAAWDNEPSRLAQHATESDTHMCTLSCCEIICRKARESSPVPSGDNRRSMSPTVGCGMSKNNAAIS
eukprot:2162452-Pleurochrysis_carterae.AAC.1